MITLATLDKATEQDVFDQAVTHMLTQNQKSEEANMCKYRSSTGLKCVAGCYVSDEEYRQSFEGRVWSLLVSDGLVPSSHLDLINRLQDIHDRSRVCDWSSLLESLGMSRNLQFNPPSNG